MKELFKSATKIVFLMMAMSVIVLTYVGKIDAKDFYALVLVVFYHYYNKQNVPQDVDKSTSQESNLG